MGYEWRVFLPLTTEVAPKPDIALLLGRSVVVDTLDEIHYIVDDALDLRRVRSSDDTEVMRLSVLAGRVWSSSAQCWVRKPSHRLTAVATGAGVELCHECREWLDVLANGCEAGVARMLTELASGRRQPQTVHMRRRLLRSAVPNELGVLLEQSDLSSDDRLWRTVTVESTSPAACHRAALELRERFAADGLVQSMPHFARMLLSTHLTANRPCQAPVASSCPPERYVLSRLLTDRWLGKGEERYSQRVWRRAQDRETPSGALPMPGTDLLGSEERGAQSLAPTANAAKVAGGPVGTMAQFPAAVVQSALSAAVCQADETLLRQLLALPGININCRCGPRDAPLLTPLHLAARAGAPGCVKLLLQRHADVCALGDGGRTPIHTAAAGGSEAHAQCVELLIRYGCDVERVDLLGRTALDVATEASSDPCARVLVSHAPAWDTMRAHCPRAHVTALVVAE